MPLVFSLILTHFDQLNSDPPQTKAPHLIQLLGGRTKSFHGLVDRHRTPDENTALVVLFIEGNFGEKWSHR